MPTRCPECCEKLAELSPELGELGSRPKRYRCQACQLDLERDAAGSLVER